MKYFRNNNAQGKLPSPGQSYIFSFPPWKETELMDALKRWDKSILY